MFKCFDFNFPLFLLLFGFLPFPIAYNIKGYIADVYCRSVNLKRQKMLTNNVIVNFFSYALGPGLNQRKKHTGQVHIDFSPPTGR